MLPILVNVHVLDETKRNEDEYIVALICLDSPKYMHIVTVNEIILGGQLIIQDLLDLKVMQTPTVCNAPSFCNAGSFADCHFNYVGADMAQSLRWTSF